MQLVEQSQYIPAIDGSAKLAIWKDYEARVERGELS